MANTHTPGLYLQAPPRVAQTHTDTCWAAALESWSNSRSRPFRIVTQSQMAAEFGEGPTRGITPAVKIPQIASRFSLSWEAVGSWTLRDKLDVRLSKGIVFLAYPIGRYCHAVLVYGLSEDGYLFLMDPNGGRYTDMSMEQMLLRQRFILMWQENSLTSLGF